MKHYSIHYPVSRQMIRTQSDLENTLSRRVARRHLQAVFLDRDGTINLAPSGHNRYILKPEEIELAPGASEMIYALNCLKVVVIIITNQAAIGKRELSFQEMEKINERLWRKLSRHDAHYDALYFCPHSPEIIPNCFCRKPKPGLIFQAAIDFNIDLSSSFMIGDNMTDVYAGQASGCKTILISNNIRDKGERRVYESDLDGSPDFDCQNLVEATVWLLRKITSDI